MDRSLSTLSGGQVISLGLAAQLLRRPDVLLLDEPTNNLDLVARHQLYDVLSDFGGCLLLVSHDRALLERMERIAELGSDELRLYGGSFTAYEQAVRAEQEVAEKNVRNAEQEWKREKRELQQARERAERRAGNAARNLKNAGLPKIFAGTMKRGAQEAAGRSGTMHAARVSDAKARLEEAGRAVREEQRLTLELPDPRARRPQPVPRPGPAGPPRREGRVRGRRRRLEHPGPQRIALTGPNGAGKTTLMRLVTGLSPQQAGRSRATTAGSPTCRSAGPAGLGPHRGRELRRVRPRAAEAERMNVLARFLFRGARAHLPVGVLSGGERLRATLACVLCAEPAPHLLLLDEPTNNLDLVSAGQLESALDSYRGAFMVVSHDERFLAQIGISRWLRLAGGR